MPKPSRGTAPRFHTQCFSVLAQADPQTLPRVLAPFAKRGLVPDSVQASRGPGPKGNLHIDLQLAGADPALAQAIAQELRRQVCVETVLLAELQCTQPNSQANA